MKKLIYLPVLFAAIVLISSCSKQTTNPDLTTNVVGKYTGTLQNTSTSSSADAITDVTKENDFTVKIHCYSNDFDTTYFLELYEDGAHMRVCFTDDDFKQEYGHDKSDNHHMMDNNMYMGWNDHMSSEHDANDEHYGDFNMDNNTFNYTFKLKDNHTEYSEVFSGGK